MSDDPVTRALGIVADRLERVERSVETLRDNILISTARADQAHHTHDMLRDEVRFLREQVTIISRQVNHLQNKMRDLLDKGTG